MISVFTKAQKRKYDLALTWQKIDVLKYYPRAISGKWLIQVTGYETDKLRSTYEYLLSIPDLDMDIDWVISERDKAFLSALSNGTAIKTPWQMWEDLLRDNHVYLEKGLEGALYRALDSKTRDAMLAMLEVLKPYIRPATPITWKEAEEVVYLEELVYPNQVLLAHLTGKRNAGVLLKQCMDGMPNPVIVSVTRKWLKKLVDQKADYYDDVSVQPKMREINPLLLAKAWLVFNMPGVTNKTPISLLYQIFKNVSESEILRKEYIYDCTK